LRLHLGGLGRTWVAEGVCERLLSAGEAQLSVLVVDSLHLSNQAVEVVATELGGVVHDFGIG